MTLFPIVILAGGLATRLQPLTSTLPKSLIPINGKPFIDIQLELLAQIGFKKIILAVGFLGELIQQHVGDGSQLGLSIEYSFDGETLLGTGGAIKKALSLLGNDFFVMYGDSYLSISFSEVQQCYLAQKKLGLMTIFENKNQWDRSNVEYRDGKILKYDKKNITENMYYIDYGLGILNSKIFENWRDERFDLAAIYQNLLSQNQLGVYVAKKRFYEIGSFAGLEEYTNY